MAGIVMGPAAVGKIRGDRCRALVRGVAGAYTPAMLLMGMLMLLQGADPLGEADKLFGLEKYVEAVELYKKCGDASVEALAQIARCMSLVGKLDEVRGWLARAAKLATEQ